MDYGIKGESGNMQITKLSTPDGKPYITNTMDIVLNMENGSQYCASKSIDKASLNIYRYGYYYFENRIEGQRFKNELIVDAEYVFDLSQAGLVGVKSAGQSDDGAYLFDRRGNDPQIIFGMDAVNITDYDFIEITMQTPSANGEYEVFIKAGDDTEFNSTNSYAFAPSVGEEYVTYKIPLASFKSYFGQMTGLRFDINSLKADVTAIKSIKLLKVNYAGAPEDLTIQRSFVTYSDKLHHVVQFSTPTELSGVKNVQIVTKIDASTVEKFIIKDRKAERTDLDSVLWNHVEYAAFDIKDAGIFGYILPYDERGTFKVTLENGYYVITHTKEIANGTFIPSKAGSKNSNDVFMGNRIYTDTNHDFEAFIIAAECERTPLEAEKHINANNGYDNAKYLGYDPLYGYYKFSLIGTSFTPAYSKHPNKQYRVNFTITGDKYDRNIYCLTFTDSGCLESAALLDKNDLLLPVPMQVSKNFKGDGENTIYNLDDAAYGEVYLPITVKSKETLEYTVLNLYQNWGKFPLKQISSIQYFSPYYHLSTGVTETNCIVQLATAGPGLPDHRAMSAPFWPTQPQHNSGGGHQFLAYTDANGQYATSNNVSAVIDSYGPTYCDITLGYVSSDGKIKAEYNHMEMPQIDENRAYYEMKYTFLEDVSFADFSQSFKFYNVTDNNPKGTYKRVGYLDENNVSQVVPAISKSGEKQTYVLGDKCPYFSFFDMPDYDKEWDAAFGYTNLACLIYSHEVVINGEKTETQFLLTNTLNYLKLSLNIQEVTFKAGDTISLNMILMPWGSQEMDGMYDEIQDQNVRNVRDNTLLNPFKITAKADCEEIESVFLPKAKTTNGVSAEFTVSGGHDNNTVRIYGFKKLTAPVIEELIEGKWVKYDVSSINSKDSEGNGYCYDGYMVYYDGNGTFSYSFVIEMNEGAQRTFRISAEKDFEGWPERVPTDEKKERNDPINVHVDAEEIFSTVNGLSSLSKVELADDGSYVRLYPNPDSSEAYSTLYSAADPFYEDLEYTGQYIMLKYRLPSNASGQIGTIELFANTESPSALGTDRMWFNKAIHDGEWHVLVFDAAALMPDCFIANSEGKYKSQFLRLDFFGPNLPTDLYIDIAYLGMCDSWETVCSFNSDMEIIDLVKNPTTTTEIDPETGKAPVVIYVDPSSGYTQSTVPFAGWIDYINGQRNSKGVAFDKDVWVYDLNNTTIENSLVSMTGWVVAEGGIEKYVWSADGGKTWNDVTVIHRGGTDTVPDANVNVVPDISATHYTIVDKEASKVNAGFSGNPSETTGACPGIAADLSDYIGKTVNVTFAAVPKSAPDTLCIISHMKGVQVVAGDAQ